MYLTRDKMFQLFHDPDDGGMGNFDLTTASDEDILNASDEQLGLESDDDDDDDSETNTDDGADSDVDSDEGNEEETEEVEESEDEQEQETEEEEQEESEEAEEEGVSAEETLTFTAIKKEYPEFFKKFPQFKAVVGKVQQYEEVFPDVNTAREVVERVEAYDQLAAELEVGSPVGLMQTLAQNPAAFTQFADNFLPALHRFAPNVFYDVTAPVLTTALNSIIKEFGGKEDQQSKNMTLAARYVSKYLFNSAEIPDLRPRNRNTSPQQDPEKLRLMAQNNEFMRERLSGAAVEVDTAIKTSINKLTQPLIGKVLEGQPKYLATKIKQDILQAIDSEIASDQNFINSQKQLWARAARTGFNDKTVTSRIKSAYLERGKKVAAKIVNRVLTEAGLKQVNNNKNVKVRKTAQQNAQGAVKRGGSTNAHKINPGQVDWRRTSDLDILNGNIKIKGKK